MRATVLWVFLLLASVVGAIAAESPNNTVVTTVGPTITDASANVFSISVGAQVVINGTPDGATSNVIELAYVNHVLWQENTVGNWYNYLGSPGSYGGPTTISPLASGPSGTGNFRVTGGQIIDPQGKLYVPVGINIDDNEISIASINSLGQPLTTLFPGINHIRLRTNSTSNVGTASATYPSPSTFSTFVSQMTALGIVVEIEDHSCNGGFWEGSGGLNGQNCALPQQGSGALVPITNFYAALANAYKSNPYVWFGSMNEPSSADGTYSTSAIATVSNYQQAIYNAVRGTGAANMMQMLAGIGGGNCGTVGASGGFVPSAYAPMTNIVWELHAYYTNGSTVPNSGYTNATAYVQGQTGAQCGGSGGSGYLGAQTINSADGLVPVLYGEWGSGDGNASSTNASQLGAALVAVATSKSFGNTGWAWYPSAQWQMVWNGFTAGLPTCSPVNQNSNPGNCYGLSLWGQQMASVVAQVAPLSGPTGPPSGPVQVPAPLTGSVTTGNWTAYNQTFSGVTLACGKPFHFIVLPPAQYNASAYKYPLLIWLHPDHQGDPWYLGQNTDPLFLANDESANFNLVPFRTAYPAVVVAAYADQTNGNGSLNSCNSQADSAVENWGGWVNTGVTGSGTVYSGDTGPNVFALLAMVSYLETQYSIDTTRIYTEGFSLGAIGSEYLMQKYNTVNGSPGVFAAAASMAGVLQINGFAAGPTTSQKTAMTNVPVWWFGGANDGASVQSQWNEPMFVALSGGSSAYPPAITSVAANRAGNSQMEYTLCPSCGHQDTDANGNPVWVNTTIMNWMFSINGTPSTGCPPNCTPPPPPSSATTWDPARVPAQITLSGSNQIASTTSAVSPNSITVFSTTSRSTGKYCFAVNMTTSSTNWSVGIANNSFPQFPTGTAGLGGDTFGLGFYPVSPPQALYYAGVMLASGASADSSGDEIDECVDLDADLAWVSTPVMRAAGQAWNNDVVGNQNPATGTGGKSFSGLTCPCYIVFNTMDFPSVASLNAGGPFAVALPSGFLVWAPPAVSSHSPIMINLGANDNHPLPANDTDWQGLYSPASFGR